MLQSIINSNFFKNNPDKVLGVPYQTKGRWGEVTKYKGTMLDLDKINVPDYIVADMLMPNMSSEAYLDLENLQPAAVENIKIAIKKAKQEKIVASQSSDNAKLDIVTFEEVDARYNAHLSTDEKQAFVYYMYRVLGRNMQGGWRKYIVPANQEKQKIQDWISKGIVYYSNKIIVPSFVYFSGEMWQKENDLEHEKDFIIEEYGEAAYQAQKESFAKAKQDPNSWYNKRLLIDDPIAENRLVLKPNCELAKTFQIQGIKSTSEALVGTKTKNGVKTIDFKKDPTSKYDRFSKTIKDEDQPLQFWFIIWLKDKAKKQEIAIKKGLDWQEVYEIGVTGRKRHEDEEKDAFTKKKANAKAEAQRLFSQFLIDELELNDKVRLENQWNIAYNGSALMDLEKVPIGFSHARVYGGMEIEVRPEKREAVAFAMMQGTGCLAYGVGLGKTWCAVFIMAQFMENGWAERPLLAVPNQVYKQFMNEIKGICPQYQVNDLYNLSTEYESRLQKKNDKFSELKSQSITIVTYEGFKKLGLGNEGAAIDAFQARLSDIYSQQGSNQSETQRAKREEKNEGKVGQSVRGSYISVIDLEIDMLLVDEAHSMKKVFTEVKSKEDEDGRKGNKKYNITSGTPSIMAQKGFMIAQYIQFKKKTGNCIILTATPFTNSPLEVFSMLALINYPLLNRKGYFSLETFFDNFADIQNELTISATLQPVMKEIFVGFNNLPALHKLIQECFLYKQSVANLQRPNKIVLPLREKLINGVLVPLADREKIDTNLQMTSLQSKLMSDIVAYAEGRIEFDQLENSNKIDFDDEEENEDDILDVGETISEKSLTKEEDKAVRLLLYAELGTFALSVQI